MNSNFSETSAWACLKCKSRTKFENCSDVWHLNGFLLSDICFDCKSLSKLSQCSKASHVNGCPIVIHTGLIVDSICKFCRNLSKNRNCRIGSHDDGELVVSVTNELDVRGKQTTNSLSVQEWDKIIHRLRPVGSSFNEVSQNMPENEFPDLLRMITFITLSVLSRTC